MQNNAQITSITVVPVIRVFFNDTDEHCHYDIHPLQDRELLESVAHDNGTAPGLRLSVFSDSSACLYSTAAAMDDAFLALLERNASSGEFAGLHWQLRAYLNDGSFFALSSGDSREGIERLKSLLEQIPVEVAIKVSGGAVQAVRADRPIEVTLVDEDFRREGGDVPTWEECEHLQHEGW